MKSTSKDIMAELRKAGCTTMIESDQKAFSLEMHTHHIMGVPVGRLGNTTPVEILFGYMHDRYSYELAKRFYDHLGMNIDTAIVNRISDGSGRFVGVKFGDLDRVEIYVYGEPADAMKAAESLVGDPKIFEILLESAASGK